MFSYRGRPVPLVTPGSAPALTSVKHKYYHLVNIYFEDFLNIKTFILFIFRAILLMITTTAFFYLFYFFYFLIWFCLYFLMRCFRNSSRSETSKIQALESIFPEYVFIKNLSFQIFRGFFLNKLCIRIP